MKCPWCTETRKTADRSSAHGNSLPEAILAKHATNHPDHPEISYVEAKKRVITYNEGKDTDNEGSIEEVDIDETPHEDTGTEEGAEAQAEETPGSTAPVVTDGGETETEDTPSEAAEDNETEETPEGHCPSCNVPMATMKEEVTFIGSDGGAYQSDGSENRCPSCGAVKDGDTWL